MDNFIYKIGTAVEVLW